MLRPVGIFTGYAAEDVVPVFNSRVIGYTAYAIETYIDREIFMFSSVWHISSDVDSDLIINKK